MSWTVYVLSSPTHPATYVGIAVDVERRLRQHNGELNGGARFTRAGRPWALAASYGPFESRSEAQRAEFQLKNLRGQERLGWAGLDEEKSGEKGGEEGEGSGEEE